MTVFHRGIYFVYLIYNIIFDNALINLQCVYRCCILKKLLYFSSLCQINHHYQRSRQPTLVYHFGYLTLYVVGYRVCREIKGNNLSSFFISLFFSMSLPSSWFVAILIPTRNKRILMIRMSTNYNFWNKLRKFYHAPQLFYNIGRRNKRGAEQFVQKQRRTGSSYGFGEVKDVNKCGESSFRDGDGDLEEIQIEVGLPNLIMKLFPKQVKVKKEEQILVTNINHSF